MMINKNLKEFWNKPVKELVSINQIDIDEGKKERHRLYSLLLMAIVHHYWNGNKHGREGEYPLNENEANGEYFNKDYIGHNIASLAVDANGKIMDFDFNHNELFCRSTEHAEVRTIERIYKLAKVHETWEINLNKNSPKDCYTTFNDVSLYTSLESCSQCSGVMALAKVKEVIYLQSDPTMYMIGNILRNLTYETDLEAPQPITGAQIELPFFDQLNLAYDNYVNIQDKKLTPFYIYKDGEKKFSSNITSFLCTRLAYEIYNKAKVEFDQLISGKKTVNFNDFKPEKDKSIINTALTNQEVLNEVKNFYQYAIKDGRRGTPH